MKWVGNVDMEKKNILLDTIYIFFLLKKPLPDDLN